MSIHTVTDPIYGAMELLPCQIELLNTVEFQRLTRLRQLGVCYKVFPGATHTRAEHSLGVAWLARKLVRQLRLHQPNIVISDYDEQLIALAGQAHDLGHGIASHAFEAWLRARALAGRLDEPTTLSLQKGPILRSAAKKLQATQKHTAKQLSLKMWSHEEQSILILEHAIKNGHLKSLKEPVNACQVMAALIRGQDTTDAIAPEKKWMLEIVNNACCGIDVDRLDYLQRDAHHLFGSSGDGGLMNVDKIIGSVRITADRQHLAFDVTLLDTLYHIFHRRWSMFRSVYLHNEVVGYELALRSMLDALYDSATFSLLTSNALTDIDQYLALDDTIFSAACMMSRQSKADEDKNLQRACNEWTDFQTGKNKFVCVAKVNLSAAEFQRVGDVTVEQLLQLVNKNDDSDDGIIFDKDDLQLHCCAFHFGAGNTDPLSRIWFYNVETPASAFQLDSLHENAAQRLRLTPRDWQEWQVRVYSQNLQVQKVALRLQTALQEHCT